MVIGHRPTTVIFTLSVAFATALAGCASPGQPSMSQDDWTQSLHPATPIAMARLFPFTQHSGTAQQTLSPGNATKTIGYSLSPHSQDRWKLTLDNIRVTYFSRSKDGATLIHGEDELSKSVRVEYHPPIVALPATVKTTGSSPPVKSRMTVLNLANGSPRDTGWCTSQSQLLGTRPMQTPHGLRNAYIVRTTRQIDLQLAEVSVTTLSAYVPELGWVADRIEQITKPMRIMEIHSSEQLRLMTTNRPPMPAIR